MAKHNDLGILGEKIAVDFLINNGYTILSQNYRFKRAEVDIIAEFKGELIFIEVKTRSSSKHEYPEEAVTLSKQKLLFQASEEFLFIHQKNHLPVRFDIIAIIIPQNSEPEILHIMDAFRPDFTIYS